MEKKNAADITFPTKIRIVEGLVLKRKMIKK